MIKLTQLINELEINNPNRATLAQLRRWKIEIEKSDDIITKTKLALKCVEGVIWMWNKSHPHDDRPQKAINAVKTYLKDPSKENMKECENVNTGAWNAYYDTSIVDNIAAAAAQLTQSVYFKYDIQGNFSLYAADRAIEAVIIYNRVEWFINELEINKPSQINKLKVGQIYKITYREDIYDEEDLITDNLKILDKWTDVHGLCVTAIPITEENNPDDFQLFLWEENIVKVEPYNINELHVNNPNATREEVEYFWRHNIALTTNYRKLKIKYVDEYMDDSRFVPDTEFLIQSLPQHALNKFYRDLKKLYKQQQYKEDPNNLAESLNKFVEIDEIEQILSDKFPQYQNKIQEYIKTIEIEPENYEYLTYHHLLDDFENFVSLNELEINKPIKLLNFKNNKWERGKNVKETITNFIKANPYQPYNVIIREVSKIGYNSLVVSKGLSNIDTSNGNVKRIKTKNPDTGRQVYIYYISQS